MKLLLGILLALVLIEGVAIVGLYLRQDQQPHALITRAGPGAPVETAPSTLPVPATSDGQSQRFEEFTANLEALRAEVESLRAAGNREQVQPAPSPLVDLHADAFKSSVRELSVQAVSSAEEAKRFLAFQAQVPRLASDLLSRRPLKYGTSEDLERIFLELNRRSRGLHLEFMPTGKKIVQTDANYPAWFSRDADLDAWAVGELERLYGIPLDLNIKTWTRASIDHCVASDE
jgi:hypothetical protein